jgi:hypothetical protein
LTIDFILANGSSEIMAFLPNTSLAILAIINKARGKYGSYPQQIHDLFAVYPIMRGQ